VTNYASKARENGVNEKDIAMFNRNRKTSEKRIGNANGRVYFSGIQNVAKKGAFVRVDMALDIARQHLISQ